MKTLRQGFILFISLAFIFVAIPMKADIFTYIDVHGNVQLEVAESFEEALSLIKDKSSKSVMALFLE